MSRRILVPLCLPVSREESTFLETVLPDACRLAGPGGTLVLVCDVADPLLTVKHKVEDYLSTVAEQQCGTDRNVETHVLRSSDVARALDEAVGMYKADMIACATHGSGPFGRLMHGGTAWRVLAGSEVPVLIRYAETNLEAAGKESSRRRILVPLDGSRLAEAVLPLVEELANEWHALVFLTQVVRRSAEAEEVDRAHAYLEQLSGKLSGKVETHVLTGQVVDSLVKAVGDWQISDVVMASHGRTGLARVILGSVADGLVQRLHCPIIVLPLNATLAYERAQRQEMDGELVSQR